MTDDDRKLLTLYLGEIFSPGLFGWPYDHKGKRYSNRTFDNWPDLGALKEKLVEKGGWDLFCEWTAYEENYNAESLSCEFTQWADWLFNPSRFPELVAEWLKGRG